MAMIVIEEWDATEAAEEIVARLLPKSERAAARPKRPATIALPGMLAVLGAVQAIGRKRKRRTSLEVQFERERREMEDGF